MREHAAIRDQVHAGLSALRVQARQIWGDTRNNLPEIVTRLMVGVGDLARLSRDRFEKEVEREERPDGYVDRVTLRDNLDEDELKKELGNILLSTVRWIDDLGLDVLECLDLAIEAQEKFANSGRPR